MLIILIAVLSIVLCLLMGMCLFLENRENKNSEIESESVPVVEQEVRNTEETRLLEVTGRPTEERVETDVADINLRETTVPDRETDRDYQTSGDYESDRDYDTNEDCETGSGNITDNGNETSGGNETNSSNETDRDNETGRD